jgi:lysophospholipase L1-like esterase
VFRTTWRWLALLVVLSGAAGHVVESRPVPRPPVARGDFWAARSRDGGVLAVDAESGLVIGPGDSLQLEDEDRGSAQLRRVSLRVQRAGSQSSYVRIHFRQSDAGRYSALLVPGTTVTASLSLVPIEGESVPLANAELGGMADDAEVPFEVTLALDGPRLSLSQDGRLLAQADDATLPAGRCTIWADGVRVHALQVEGCDTQGRSFSRSVEIADLQGTAAASVLPMLAALAEAAALALAVAGFLRALCLARPPARELAWATLLALVPVSALVACRGLLHCDLPAPLAVLVGLLGSAPALTALRRQLGGRDAAREPLAAREPRAVRRDAWRAALVAVALAGATTWAAGAGRLRVVEALREREIAAIPSASAEGFAFDGPLRLDASNALPIPTLHRSFTLRATVTLDESSWLEVRTREGGAEVMGVALFLGTDARMRTGFVEEGEVTFTPIGDGSGPLPAGRPLGLELHVEDSHFEARIDGARVAQTDERRHPVGGSTILAVDGAATIADLRLDALAEPPVRGPAREVLAATCVPPALWIVLAVACALCLRVPWWRAPELAAWALVPLAVVLAGSDASGLLGASSFVAGALAALGALLVIALAQGRGLRAALLPLLGLACVPFGLQKAAGPPMSRELSGQNWALIDVPRLAPGLAHVQHPVLRRWNHYLDAHALRGKHYAIPKPQGTLRVICLGTSSTWGHGIDEASGLDYPSILGALLSQRLPDQPLEVINAGVSSHTTPRLLRFLREVLLEFEPDVVVFSLSYNDAFLLNQFDEHRWLTRFEQPDADIGWFDKLALAWESERGLDQARRFEAQRERFGRDSLAAWRAAVGDGPTPVDRFETVLRAVADLLQSRGIALVLVKEAQRGDEPRLWKPELYAAIDRLGAEYGAPVVDPKPALEAAGGATMFMDQVHMNPRGNRVQAMAIAPVVESAIRSRASAFPASR